MQWSPDHVHPVCCLFDCRLPMLLNHTYTMSQSPDLSLSPLHLNGLGLELDDARKSRQEPVDEQKPYPLCLLCLTRPPSAVILPCR